MAHASGRDTEGWFDWAYKGVDPSFPGNGGLECRDFLSISQRCWESLAASVVAALALIYAYPRLKLPASSSCANFQKQEPLGKRILLLLMCLTFGIELGFKLATRQMIWIGNPCHLATMMQIFILAAPPSRIVTAAFRLHMHMLTGAPIAILFPVINTRLLPFETGVYFLQHILMLVIPFYLIRLGDPFIPETLGDFSWALTSFGFLFIYHFLPLQLLAYISQVNLNNMLCPAVSDPFHGKFYRLFAICHQLILIPSLGKLFVIVAKAFGIVPCNNPPDVTPLCEAISCDSQCTDNVCSSTLSDSTTCSKEYCPIQDLGCGESNCMAGSGFKVQRGNPPSHFCSSCAPSSYSSCGLRRCVKCNPSNRSHNSDIVHTQHLVNGELVRANENHLSNWDTSCCQRGPADCCTNKCCYQHTFILRDSQDSQDSQDSVCESENDKSLRLSDLEQSSDGRLKSQ